MARKCVDSQFNSAMLGGVVVKELLLATLFFGGLWRQHLASS